MQWHLLAAVTVVRVLSHGAQAAEKKAKMMADYEQLNGGGSAAAAAAGNVASAPLIPKREPVARQQQARLAHILASSPVRSAP